MSEQKGRNGLQNDARSAMDRLIASDPRMLEAAGLDAQASVDTGTGKRSRVLLGPRAALGQAALEHALTPAVRVRARRNQSMLVVIEAPTTAWAGVLADAVTAMFPACSTSVCKEPPKPGAKVGGVSVASAVFAVSSDLSWLAPSLVAGADVTLAVSISPAVIGRALTLCLGRSAPVRAADIAGLDVDDFVVAIRPQAPARACIKRFARAAASRSLVIDDAGVPTLDELVGYGAALGDVMRAADDIVAVRDGVLSGRALTSLLFYGPPGTGKTQLARSLAKTVGLPVVSTTVGGWFKNNAHLGNVIVEARSFFDAAAASAPCIAFIDELDAIPDRAKLDDRDRSWWTPIVTFVLTAIDRVRRRGGVLLVGAINLPENLDAALKRPGRFDRHIEIAPPQTGEALIAIFRAHLQADLATAELGPIAQSALAQNATGAAVEAWVKASRETARAQRRPLALSDLSAAVLPATDMPAEAQMRLALHEAAHAVVGRALGLTVPAVSMVAARSSLARVTIEYGDAPLTRLELERHVVAGLAGRAADELMCEGAEAGAWGDLQKATSLVASIHRAFGLGDRLVNRAPPDKAAELLAFDPELCVLVEHELQRLMGEARRQVETLEQAIRALAKQLVVQRVAGEADIDAAIAAGVGRKEAVAPEVGVCGAVSLRGAP